MPHICCSVHLLIFPFPYHQHKYFLYERAHGMCHALHSFSIDFFSQSCHNTSTIPYSILFGISSNETNVSTGHFFWVQYYSLKRNGKVKYLVDPFTGIAMIFRPLISFSLDFSTAIKIRPPLHTQENYNNKIKWKKTKRNCQPIAFHTVYSVHKWNICSFVCICMFFFVLQFFVSFCHLTQCMNLFILLP